MKPQQFPYKFRNCLPSFLRAESVYFYTFHKCASTLFSQYVLKNVKGLNSVNYADQIYKGERNSHQELTFQKKGCIYGPIRLSANMESLVKRLLVDPTTTPDFIRYKIAVFFIRDPRDILVSAYYSFGFTHGLSAVHESRVLQEARQNMIQQQTLDEYVLAAANDQIRFFHTLHKLSEVCERGVILRYEDMIEDFDTFAKQLVEFMPLSKKTIEGMRRKSRPKIAEDLTSHRRSGKIGGFQSKLQAETVEALNEKLAETLQLFNYQP